ncbi:hypothetical protein KZC52_12575 [Microbacterium sp. kSW2-24]|uniref:hypothetical protein n=1 Tax=Microbacterium galbinum TaxID=2851646 RepID=UPI001FFD670C|nr:hypothetical protein [Microbacterium galbinum]MCK2023765.1 hypothetical protein [Microbacterium galbinum]
MNDLHEWPGDSTTVERWMRDSLRPDPSEFEIRGIDDVRISSTVDGDDLERLVVDGTGVALRLRVPKHDSAPGASARPAASAPPATPEIVERRRGTARTVRMLARPVEIEGIPLTIDVQLDDAPIEWQVSASPVVARRPESRYAIVLADDGEGMRGSFLASMAADDLTPLLTAILRPALKAGGARLRHLAVTAAQDGTDGIRIDAAAGVRWRLIGASARGRARIGVEPDGVVTVRDLRVGSRNPFVALALRAARKTIRAEIGRRHNLNESLTADGMRLRLHDLRVTVGDEIRVSARLG